MSEAPTHRASFRQRCRRATAPLHRRIFLWFGLAIVLASIASFAASTLAGGMGESRKDWRALLTLLEGRFADTWSDPVRRRTLAEELHRELRLDLELQGADGTRLEAVGEPCVAGRYVVEPKLEGRVLGRVAMCPSAERKRRPFAMLFGLCAALGALWLLSHRVSRHLGRPLARLAEAATAIGRGRFDVDLGVKRGAPVEIHRLAEALAEMNTKIQAQLSDQRELLAAVSHELRTPLSRLRLLSELVREPANESARAKHLAELEQEIEEIDELVGGLLAGSRLDFGAMQLREHDLVAAARHALERAGSTAELRIVGEPRSVIVDATLLARALANLVDNATKHGDGLEGLELTFEPERVGIAALDRGPGLGAAGASRVFEPFYTTKPGERGSVGLGLALVKRIAESHRGDAFAEERPGGGARIGFWVEASDDDDES
jgi:two-component system, OmpR family, sensor kinase